MEEQSSESIKAEGEKNMDFLTSPYLVSGDNFQPLSGLMDHSPFKFYNNNKLQYLNRLAQGNEEPLSNMLKGFSFAFPINGTTPLPRNNFVSDAEEKPIDTANLAAFLSRNTPFDHNKIFNFQHHLEERKDNEEIQLNCDLAKMGSQFILTPNLMMDPSSYKSLNIKEFSFDLGTSDPLRDNLKEGMDLRAYYGKIDELGDPKKKIKHD